MKEPVLGMKENNNKTLVFLPSKCTKIRFWLTRLILLLMISVYDY